MDDVLERYREAGAWAAHKVAGATDQFDAATPCDGWDVRRLLSHMIETQQYFASSARGESASISPDPPALDGDDPAADYRAAVDATIDAFGQDGVIERTGPTLAIACSDTLLHGWDVARATGQDTTMPPELAQAAYDTIHGAFTDDQRAGTFKPALAVGDEASAQEKLLAYTGRNPG